MEKNVQLRTTIAALLVCIIIAGLIIYYIVLLNPEPTPEELNKLIISTSSNTANVLVYIAEKHNYFTVEGLDVGAAPYESEEEAFQTLLQGEADFCIITNDLFVKYAMSHNDVQILCALAKSPQMEFMVYKDVMIPNLSSERVKRVGIPDDTMSLYYLDRYLLYNNILGDDIELSYDTCENVVDGLLNGKYNGALICEPYLYNFMMNHEDSFIQAPGSNSRYVYYLLIAKKRWLGVHPEQAVGFVKALVRAEDWLNKGDEHAWRYVAHTSGTSIERAKFLLGRYNIHISLPKELLIILEDQTRWLINQQKKDISVPNYLKYIYFEPLTSVNPQRVEIVH